MWTRIEAPLRTLVRRLDSPLVAFLIVGAAAGLFAHARWQHFDRDASVFVTAGANRCDAAQLPHTLHIRPIGYDGQYYYAMALAPLRWVPIVHGVQLDKPPYRLQRVLYPLAAWLAAAGDPDAVPLALIVVNVLAIALVGAFAAALAQHLGAHALVGVVLGLSPTFAFSLARDLAEPMEAALLLAALLAMQRRRAWLAGVMFSLAVLTRETALLAVVGVAAGALLHRVRRSPRFAPAWPTFALPIGVFLVWQGLLAWRWHELPLRSGQGNLVAPLTGLAPFVASLGQPTSPAGRLWQWELITLFVVVVSAALALRRSPWPPAIRLTWALYLVFPLLWSALIWVEDWAFMRGLTELWLLSLLVLVAQRSRWTWPALGLSAALTWQVARKLVSEL